MRILGSIGATTGIKTETAVHRLQDDWRDALTTIVRGRVYRFYVPSSTGDPKGSRWKGEIQEKNLLGGLNESDRNLVKAHVLPAMLKLDFLVRRGAHGTTLYRLTNEAEDDARALIEQDKVVGKVKLLINGLL